MRGQPLLFAGGVLIVVVMDEGDSPKRGRKREEGQAPETAEPGRDTPKEGESADNPWLPASGESSQRRSARMEDILRQRRPAGSPIRLNGSSMWLMAAVAVISAWLISTTVHNLRADERGLVTTFGRYSATIGPGLNLTLPWPIQTVVRSETGKDKALALPVDDSETLMLTRDGEVVDLRMQVRWRITDLRRFSSNLADPEAALGRLVDSAMRAAVAELTFDEVRDEKRQAELQQRVTGRVQRVLDGWQAGITVVAVEVKAAKPPAKLTEAFKEIDKASQEARQNHETALTYAAKIRHKANLDADEFDKAYELYRIAPAVTRERIYYETIEQVLRNNPVVIGNGAGVPLPAAPGGKPASPKQGGQ